MNMLSMPASAQSRQLSASTRPDEVEPIYILGTGAVGKVVAHALRVKSKHPVPISLIFHKPALLEGWLSSDKSITVETYGDYEKSTGYTVELALPYRKSLENYNSDEARQKLQLRHDEYVRKKPISQLIVTVKAPSTVSALNSIKHRLGPESSILFLQNGMGIIEEVNKEVFTDADKRPNYLVGINSHGMTDTGPFESRHAGHGSMFLTILPREGNGPIRGTFSETARTLLQQITAIPLLAAVSVTPKVLQKHQLEKLAVNCLINPLTVMYDCCNGDLLFNHPTSRVFRLLLAEICVVIQRMPELQNEPNLATRFNPARLETLARNVAQHTSSNISSMLQDVRRGRNTEIQYLNGYIVRRGEELGTKCLMNYMLMQMVDGKYHMVAKEIASHVPLEKGSSRSSNL